MYFKAQTMRYFSAVIVLAGLMAALPVSGGEIIENGVFRVELLGNGDSAVGGAGYELGYPDTFTGTTDWNEAQKKAVIRSLDVLNNCFIDPPGRKMDIAIALRDDLPPGVLGSSGATWIFDPGFQTITTTAEDLWRDGNRTDLFPGAVDNLIEMSTSFPMHYGAEAPGPDTYDFQSIITHEIVHALGMGTSYFGEEYGYYYGIKRWDSLMQDNQGNRPAAGSIGDPNAMVVIGPEGTVYWMGEHANATYGGPVPIYTNSDEFWGGSSLSHPYPAGELMAYSRSTMELTRIPGKLFLDMFRDMGWTINPDYYNAFGPTLFKDEETIVYGDTFVSDYAYAYAMYVNGNGNHISHTGVLEAQGDFSRALHMYGVSNRLDISGILESSGDYSQALYVYGAETRINHQGVINVKGEGSAGMQISGRGNQIIHSGSTIAPAGSTAIRLDNPYSSDMENSLHISKGSYIQGNIVNSDTLFDAAVTFGYAYSPEDGSLLGEEDGFSFSFDDDFIGRWAGVLGAGVTALNGNSEFQSLVIEAPATLKGVGTITGTVTNRGRVSPGNSIGTLTINGDYTHGSDAVYEVEMGQGRSDKLVVDGTADILGGAISLVPSGYLTAGSYSFLQAGTLKGSFSQVTTPAVFNAGLANPSVDSLSLNITRNSYAALGSDADQTGIGNALDNMRPSSSMDMAGILDRIDQMDLDHVRNAVDDLSPGFHSSVTAATLLDIQEKTYFLQNQIMGLGAYSPAGSDPSSSPASSNALQVKPLTGEGDSNPLAPFSTFWFSGLYTDTKFDTIGKSSDFRSGLGGVMMGLDHHTGPGLRFGFAGAFTKSDTDEIESSSSGKTHAYNGYIYGVWDEMETPGGFYGQTILGLGWEQYNTDRAIPFQGRTATSEHDAWHYSAYLGGGYNWIIDNWSFGPVIGAEYIHLREDGFEEKEADSANLAVAPTRSQTLSGNFGVRISRDFSLNKMVLIPDLRLDWVHHFKTDAEPVDVAFLETGNDRFSLSGRDPASDVLKLNVDLKAVFSSRINGHISYNRTFMEDPGYALHRFAAGLEFLF
jgi:outer membrane autotransporter protein